MISEPRKLFEKHTSTSIGELGEQEALPWLSPATSDCPGKACQ